MPDRHARIAASNEELKRFGIAVDELRATPQRLPEVVLAVLATIFLMGLGILLTA